SWRMQLEDAAGGCRLMERMKLKRPADTTVIGRATGSATLLQRLLQVAAIELPDVPVLGGAQSGGGVVLQVVVVNEDVGGGVVVLHRQVLQNLLMDDVEGGVPLGHVRRRLLDLLLLIYRLAAVVHVVKAALVRGLVAPEVDVIVGIEAQRVG